MRSSRVNWPLTPPEEKRVKKIMKFHGLMTSIDVCRLAVKHEYDHIRLLEHAEDVKARTLDDVAKKGNEA